MITLLLADDHPFFIEGVRSLLQDFPDIEVVGHASNGAQALQMIQEQDPDIAVLDISMPEMTGISIANRLCGTPLSTRIIILSVFEDRHHVRQAIEAGVRGYVLKRSTADDLVFAIRAVSQGGLYVDPVVAGRMLSMGGASRAVALDSEAADPALLTPREEQVLRSFAHGYTIKEVAAQLGITIKSVETYKTRASEKLHLGSRAKIVRFAMRQGWFDEAHG